MTIEYDIDDTRDRYLATFGYQDAKGRPIGSIVETWLMVACYGPGPEWALSDLAPGPYYAVRVQASRGGQPFGATQPRHYFATEEDREAFIARRLSESNKRAATRK